VARRRGDDRGLITLLFTDIVGSSEVATELGDLRWHRLQARHHAAVRKALKRFGGREVDTAGDGFFITFPSPARGVRCAFAVVREVRELGLDVRAGLHIGEAQLTGEKVGGIAVTTAARVSATAGPGEVLATDTIVHMVAGSGFKFRDLGSRELKGVPGRWDLFSVDSVDGESIGPPLDPKDARERRSEAAPQPTRRIDRRSGAVIVGALVVATAIVIGLVVRGPSSGPPSAPFVFVGLAALDEKDGTIEASTDYEGIDIALSSASPTSQSYAWVSGGHAYLPHIAKIDRSGDVVSGAGFDVRRGHYPIAIMRSRLWYAVSTGHQEINGSPSVEGKGLAIVGRSVHEDRPPLRIPLRKAHSVDALIGGGGFLWLGDSVGYAVYRIDPDARTYERFHVKQAADRLSFGDGRLWILDTESGSLRAMTPKGVLTSPHNVSGSDLTDMTFGNGSVWITDSTADQLQQIPEDFSYAGSPIFLAGVGNGPSVIDYLSTGMLVVGFDDGTVAALDPNFGTVVWKEPTGVTPSAITSGGGEVWVVGSHVPQPDRTNLPS
jgi:class 3 adenylate cyclase